MNPATRFDDAVVGAGVLGLALAYHLARRGRKVVVFDRRGRSGAAKAQESGAIWPIGQPAGPLRRMALRSREIWLEVLGVSGLWHERTGSLHLAYREDEADVLREFAGRAGDEGFRCEWLGAGEVLKRTPLVRPLGLLGALSSHWEVCIDPREVLADLPGWLALERGVRFEFGRAVVGFDSPLVRTSGGDATADRLWVSDVDDLDTLYPESAAGLGLARCSVRGLRTAPLPDGRRFGPILAGGPTLRDSLTYEGCPGLPALRARVAREVPEFDRLGLDVVASQNRSGEITLGTSRQYEGDGAGSPHDSAEIETLLVRHAETFLGHLPPILSRWHDTQTTQPGSPYCVIAPAPLVAAVAGVGGAETTLSLGLAEYVVNHVLGGD